jgi:hypothetical protein
LDKRYDDAREQHQDKNAELIQEARQHVMKFNKRVCGRIGKYNKIINLILQLEEASEDQTEELMQEFQREKHMWEAKFDEKHDKED